MIDVINTEAEVIEWITFYEEGGDINDDTMIKLLYMAQLYARSLESLE